MPYKNLKDLPKAVRDHLPRHAQEIYLQVFNNAWDQYASPGSRKPGRGREETAHRVAWAAVEKQYAKDADGTWRERRD